MGQYYDIVIKKDEYRHYDRSVDGEFMLAKLTEHAWWENECLASVCRMLYNSPANVYWVGDYADQAKPVNGMTKDETVQIYKMCNGESALKKETLDGSNPLLLDGLYLLNHTKNEYINCDVYCSKSTNSDGWCTHPLPFLTAIGNGRGTGDYFGDNKERVGEWAGDLLSVSDAIPAGFTANEVYFKGEWN